MESRYERAQKQVLVQGQGLTKENAINYLVKVKAIFLYKKDKYNQFISTLHEFYLRRIDIETVVERVKVLFEGHEELIFGFDRFLPRGCKIKYEEYHVKVDEFGAISFVGKVKDRFHDDSKEYKNFLGILSAFKRNEISRRVVYNEVSKLLEGHPDLIEGFKQFLPW